MQKDTILQITIEDMTEQGEGIGHADGYTLFVRDAVIGDIAEVKVIKAKKNYGYGKLLRILTPSPHRENPRCPAAGPCGGCQLQAMDYESQLAFKRKKVEGHLQRIGGFDVTGGLVRPVLGMDNPWEYRTKCQVPVRRAKDGHIAMGFYAGHSHRIVETERCFLGTPVNEQILGILRRHMESYHIEPYEEETGRGLVRHVLIRSGRATGEIMVCIVINGKAIPHADVLCRELMRIPGMTSVSLNINTGRDNVILGREVKNLAGTETITERIGTLSYVLSPLSFFQVNPVQTEKLYGKALEFAELTGQETVWDLYCGAGTISLFLAQRAKQVYGVEIVPEAVENARGNARINGIVNTEFYTGKAEEVFPEVCERHIRETGTPLHADVVVVDPPRKGCDEKLLTAILSMCPDRIVYVSCDSATLARDLKILCAEGNYALRKVQPVDMFPQTVHVETVVLLSRNT